MSKKMDKLIKEVIEDLGEGIAPINPFHISDEEFEKEYERLYEIKDHGSGGNK